jgi:hypothetical protein
MQENIFFNHEMQDDIFLDCEGDAWFNLNTKILAKNLENNLLITLIDFLNLKHKKVIEVGGKHCGVCSYLEKN